jgi:ketosteroid isomerase-like protein
MDDSVAFAAEVVPLLTEEVRALHDGNIGPRLELWSRSDPLTLFGAWLSASGWDDILAVFDNLSTTFRADHGTEVEVVAAESSGDLGYVVAFEHSNVTTSHADTPRSYTLRVTTILRREDGRWRVVHRHGDEVEAAPAG